MSDTISRREIIASVGVGIGALTTGAESAVAVPSGRYIVGTRTRVAAEAAKRAADSVSRELDFGDIGRAVAGRYPEAALEGLRKRPDVRYIEQDSQYHAIGETVPWGIDRVDADGVHGDGETGGDSDDGEGGADIAIIDTGIDDDHPDLDANVGEGIAFVDCEGSNCNYAWSDDGNHGTHCAGIADAEDNAEGTVGVSTRATLHAVKVLDESGSGYWSDIASGIEWVADKGYDVGSLSIGGSSSSSAIEDACRYAYEKGVLLVAAAGNHGPCTDCVIYPAKYSTVMAISATSSDDSLADFSSTGPAIDLAAPGESVYSTVIGGYDVYSGTSMACPHVAGAAGQLMDNGYANTEARRRLTETAEDIGLSSDEQGAGLLDVEAAVADGSNESPACAIVDPRDGDAVSGAVTVRVDASDGEDSDDSLAVGVSIDGGSYRTASYNTTTGYYEYTWDTTDSSDGDHTIDARATDSDGATTDAGRITVTVDNAESALAVTTGEAANVGQDTATLTGSLDDLGGAASADVYFAYGEHGTALDSTSRTDTLDSTGSFRIDVSGLSSGTDYDFRAVADASDGDSDTGSLNTFRTRSPNSVPSASIDSLTDKGNPAWDRFAVDWTGTDSDGDLASVTVELLDTSGTTLDSASDSVSGSSASGSSEVRTKRTAAEVRVIVTDTAGDSGTDSRSV